MEHLHIVNNDKFIESYINFVNTNYRDKDHYFLCFLTMDNHSVSRDHRNVKFHRKILGNIDVLIKLYSAKQIYLHSLFDIKILLILFLNPWLIKKCVWIVWGGDLYSHRDVNKGIKNKIKEKVRAFVIKRFKAVCTLVKSDYQLAKDFYNVQGSYFPAIYVGGERRLQAMSKYMKEKERRKDNEIKIIIGNSSTRTNHHKEIIDLIYYYKNQNITIYCPLSYGDLAYRDEIIQYGVEKLGDKFIPILEFMEIEDYIKLLSNMDIGIYNNDRQQGLGNIYSLLYMGKKVYLRPGTTMWQEIKENKKLNVYSIAEVIKLNFEEFHEMNESSIISNNDIMKERYDKDNVLKIWRDIFNS